MMKTARAIGAIESIRDITERKRAEITLRESEEKFVKAFRSNPGALSICRLEDGRYVEVNRGFTNMYGYGREEVIGRTPDELRLWDALLPDQIDHRRCILQDQHVIRDMEFTFRRKNGEPGTGINSAEVIDLDGVPHILSISIDITDRKQAAEALRESEAKYRTILDSPALSMFITEIGTGRLLEASEGLLYLSGYLKQAVIGREIGDGNLFFTPRDWEEIENRLLDSGECMGQAVKYVLKDGTRVDTIVLRQAHPVCRQRPASPP